VRRPRLAAKPRQHARRPAQAGRRDAPLVLERFIATLASLLAGDAARRHLGRFGLATAEWRILAALGEGRPLSAGELARRTAIEKRRVGRAVASLALGGLVERAAEAFDARRTVLRLSPKGRALYRRIVPLAAARERALLAELTAPERRQLERLLAKVLAHAAALQSDGNDPAE
jgi:DNA-binding MarR family transcriptional regulator